MGLMKHVTAAASAATLVLCAGSAMGALVIDDYSIQIGGTGLDISAGAAGDFLTANDNGIALAGTTGNRAATLTLTDVLPSLPLGDIDLQTFTLNSSVLVDGNYLLEPGNFLNSNSGLGTNGFSIELSYDIPSTNLAAHGDRFEFEFGSGDFDIDNRSPAVSLPYEIAVTSGTGTDAASVLVSDEGIYSIDFAAYSGVDFSDVTNITMTFGGQVLTPDFLVGSVSVVPAPASLPALACAGLIATRRRRA